MPNADTNYVRLSFIPEVTFNTPIANGSLALLNLPYTGESIIFDKKTVVSEEVRDDRNVQDLVWVGADVSGGVEFEVSDYPYWYNTFLNAGLMADSVSVTSHSSLTGAVVSAVSARESKIYGGAISVLTSTQNYANNETVVIGGKTYTFKTALTPTANEVLVGSDEATSIANLVAAITGGAGSGTAYAASTVTHTQVTAVGGTHIVSLSSILVGTAGNAVATTTTAAHATFTGSTLAGGIDISALKLGRAVTFKSLFTAGVYSAAIIASAGVNYVTVQPALPNTGTVISAAEFSNSEIKNGKTRSSFFIERFYSDIAQSVGFTGMMIDEISLNLDSQKIIKGSMKFVGNGYMDVGTFAPASRTLTSGNVMSASNNVAAIRFGALNAAIKSMTITMKNNLRAQDGIGYVFPEGTGVGRTEITGTINPYFNDISTYQAMTNDQVVNLIVGMKVGNYCLSLYMPAVKLAKGDPNGDGVNKDVMLPLNFQSVLLGNPEGCTMVASIGTMP